MEHVQSVTAVIYEIKFSWHCEESKESPGSRWASGVVDKLRRYLVAKWSNLNQITVVPICGDEISIWSHRQTQRIVETAVGRHRAPRAGSLPAHQCITNNTHAIIQACRAIQDIPITVKNYPPVAADEPGRIGPL